MSNENMCKIVFMYCTKTILMLDESTILFTF